MTELSESFLRELMMEEGDDLALAGILLNDSNEVVGPSSTTTDEKVRRLERELEEQKRLLSSMMNQNGSSHAASRRGTNVNEKRRQNRARLKREQEAMEREMEMKAKALLATYEQASQQNKMLKQRLELLESSVRIRDETLAALSKAKGVAGTTGQTYSRTVTDAREIDSFSCLPDPRGLGWDDAVSERVRAMSGEAYRLCWKSFVSEASLLATCIEAHGHPPNHPLYTRLANIVSHALAITDQICTINPQAYYSSLDFSLLDGTVVDKPGKGHWLACLKRISLEDSQIKLFQLAMDEHQKRVTSLLAERSNLATDLSKLDIKDIRQREVVEKLSDNVQKEAASTGLTIDLLTLTVLSPLQVALLATVSFPLIPDPTALASLAMEMLQGCK